MTRDDDQCTLKPFDVKAHQAQKQRVDEIVREAGQAEKPDKYTQIAELEQKYRESEDKRRMLSEALHSSRDQYRRLVYASENEEERALPFGVFVRFGKEMKTAIIRHHGRLYEARFQSDDVEQRPVRGGTLHAHRETREKKAALRVQFEKGELLLLNNDLHVVEGRGFDLVCGMLGTVQQILTDEKLLIKTVGDESIIITRAQTLMNVKIVSGDNIEYDPESLFAYSLLPKTNVDQLVLEKVPDIDYGDIGGLREAIDQIRDAIELPHLYPEYFREHRLIPPKGILLYGPPGCGKTLIAKAVANSLSIRIREKTGEKGESYFLNVKGPELLNKYVGATEQAIRDLFARARSQASYRTPVIIFFDEMDSMFRVRGSGISSDMESTIVPQLLAELDGLQSMENVLVIGATNREDLIDPAILRPGRLDRKIRIPRPDRLMAKDIFSKYLTSDLPLAEACIKDETGTEGAVRRMIDEIVDEMYAMKPENELVEVTFSDGTRKTLYFKDFSSGAIIENIVNRAKFTAVKDLISTGFKGLTLSHIMEAVRDEFKENENLPSNTNPGDWYRIIGKGGERVVRIRPLHGSRLEHQDTSEAPRETVKVSSSLD